MFGLLSTKILLGVLATVVLIAGLQTCRLDRAKNNLASYKVAVDQCATTNEKNSGTISELASNNTMCLAGREADERVFNEVETRWEMERGFLRERSEQTEGERLEVYRDPTCADFAKMDIRAACPSLADSLWRQAKNYYSVRNGGKESSGEDPDPGEFTSSP